MRSSMEIASVGESLKPRRYGRYDRYLKVAMIDGEVWQYDDGRPGYEEALALLVLALR